MGDTIQIDERYLLNCFNMLRDVVNAMAIVGDSQVLQFLRSLKMTETMPGFAIEIKDGKIQLVHIFRARLWTTQNDATGIRTLTYQKLIQAAEESDLETEMCFA